MGFLDRIFGLPKPSDVFGMPDNPSGFIAQLSRRKFWRSMEPQLLRDIAQHADGEMELLRNFVFVSEQYGLVSNNFVNLAQNPESSFGSPLSAFALTLYRLGSTLYKQSLSISDLEQRGFALLSADMAFTSAILCDPLQLGAYAGMAFLYGEININEPVALDWCQKYREAEDALLATPNEKLTPVQQSAKQMIQDPTESQRVMREIAKHAPHLLEATGPTEDKPMREIIEELEQRLTGSK